jgi:hypothetical protein
MTSRAETSAESRAETPARSRAAGLANARRVFIATALVLASAALLQLASPRQVCGAGAGAAEPVILLEFARRSADLDVILGAFDGSCRQRMVASLQSSNALDTWAFVPAYAALLWSLMQALAPRRGAARLGQGLVLVTAASDWLENLCISALLASSSSSAWALAWLPWVSGSKWLLLGVTIVVAGSYSFRCSERVAMRTVVLAIGVLSLIAGCGAVARIEFLLPILPVAISAAWLSLVTAVALGYLRERAVA